MQRVLIIFLVLCMACKPEHKSIDVQGHRGCRGLLPENTIPAFIKAVELGVNTLELDVVISGDGQVVVSHEALLNPKICMSPTGQPIQQDEVFNLYQMPYEEIAHCDCGSLGHPDFEAQQKLPVVKPLLKDVIIAVKNYCEENALPLPSFNVEIKSNVHHVFLYHPPISEFANRVMSVLNESLAYSQFTIQSFDITTLQYVHAAYPDVRLAFLVDEQHVSPREIDAILEKLGFTPAIYSCYYKMLKIETVLYLQKKGMLVIPWTVNDLEDMHTMLSLGVDGIITDYPDRLLEVLNSSSHN